MFTVIAKQKVLPGKAEIFKNNIAELAPKTRQCKGCISYELLQSREDENTFLIHEVWDNDDDFKAHFEEPFTIEFEKTLDGIVDGEVEPYTCNRVV